MSQKQDAPPLPEPAVTKRVTFEQRADGSWRSDWDELEAGPFTHRELNQLNRAVIVGFRNHLRTFRQGQRREHSQRQSQQTASA